MSESQLSVFEFISHIAAEKFDFDSKQERLNFVEDMTHDVSDYLNEKNDGSVKIVSSKPVEANA